MVDLHGSQRVEQGMLVVKKVAYGTKHTTVLVEDMATTEYHSQNQAKELTLVLSTDGGVVLVNEDPSGTSLQADCCVSQKLCCTNSELTYPAIYHWKQQPKPNPSVIRHTDSVE